MSKELEPHDPEMSALEEKILLEMDQLVAERTSLIQQRADLLAKLRLVDRRISDCRATARFFGLEDAIPEESREDQQRAAISAREEELHRFMTAAENRRLMSETRSVFLQSNASANHINPKPQPSPYPAAIARSATPDKAKTLRDVIIERLKLAGPSGSKAADIREFYERSSGKTIHAKTVGMTLYRLQNERLVNREGHIWFLSPPQAGDENPGEPPPGSGLFD